MTLPSRIRPQASPRRASAAAVILGALVLSVGLQPVAGAFDPVVFEATPTSSHSALLSWSWPAAIEARKLVLSRETATGWRLIDSFEATPAGTYTDELLWQRTSYTYRLELVDAGRVVEAETASIATPAQGGPFPRLYGPQSFWNTPIPEGSAVDQHSREIVNFALERFADAYTAPSGRAYPASNFAMTDGWGTPIAYADPVHSRVYDIKCLRYDCDEDVSARIPRYAKVSEGSDHRVGVIESISGRELDMWTAAYDPASDSWSAGSRYLTSSFPLASGSNCLPGTFCNGAVAAGWAMLGGVIRPEEVAQGHIDHALSLTSPTTRDGFVACPATHEDGNTKWDPQGGSYPIAIGARVQLDPDFVVPGGWPEWKREIAEALQVYGGYISDTGGSLAVKGEATSVTRGYDSWGLAGLPKGAPRGLGGDFPWGRMRVLDLERNSGSGLCG